MRKIIERCAPQKTNINNSRKNNININNQINSNIVVNNNLNGYAGVIDSNLVNIANKTTSIVVYDLNNNNNYLSNIIKSAVINANSNNSLIKKK